jgi:hypothetical protein
MRVIKGQPLAVLARGYNEFWVSVVRIENSYASLAQKRTHRPKGTSLLHAIALLLYCQQHLGPFLPNTCQ